MTLLAAQAIMLVRPAHGYPSSSAGRTKNSQIGYGGDFNSMRRIVLCSWLPLCVIASGCSDVVTTKSAEVRSPDGLWMAYSTTDTSSGPGNAGVVTNVYIERTDGSDRNKVLGVDHYSKEHIRIDWTTSRHLTIIYGLNESHGNHGDIFYQVVKCAGIDISLEAPSSGTATQTQQ